MQIYFLLFLFLDTILSYTLILNISQLQTQQLMTSQIRSHIEYLIQTYNIFVLILHSKLVKNLASLAVFNIILMVILDSVLLFGHPVVSLLFTQTEAVS